MQQVQHALETAGSIRNFTFDDNRDFALGIFPFVQLSLKMGAQNVLWTENRSFSASQLIRFVFLPERY